MLAATGNAGDFDVSALERARPELVARRLPVFAVGWLVTTAVWGFVLILDARLTVLPATLLFIFQLGVLITAIAICHHGARPARIPVVALAACVLLSLSSTSLFAAIGGYAEMLAFMLLTLFLASSPMFAWSGRAALILMFGTLVPWLLAMPFLRLFLRPIELCAAITTGAGVSLIVLEATKRNAKLALSRRTRREESPEIVAATPVAAAPRALESRAAPVDARIAMLREPLLKLKDEEVDGLRKELRRLRSEVNRRLAEEDVPAADAHDEPPPRRRRRRRVDGESPSAVK